ncbi:hypothetical protein CMI47_04785 [Candidatus Pacearchaeota archaeon]|nr:hypothetical protein [Candidatus Pacearchaeota archaeon]
MKCKAIVVDSPNNFSYKEFNIGVPLDGEVVIEPVFSSICQTDHHIIDGSLLYYRTGEAKYPIITGHEWVGYLEGTPVVGMCIFDGEGQRIEVGVINKNGGHSDILFMSQKYILEVPNMEYKYSLIEPLAVATRGFGRLNLNGEEKIIINGFGSIGKMFGRVLDYHDIQYDIYDTKRHSTEPVWRNYDVIIECSGCKDVIGRFIKCKGSKILLYGLNYDLIDINTCVSNEVNIITSLGGDMKDFKLAIEIMKDLTINECDFYELKDFSKALHCKNKVILIHA